MFNDFRKLYAASLIARYLVDFSDIQIDGPANRAVEYKSFSNYRPPEQVLSVLLLKHLCALEQKSIQFLSDRGKRDLCRTDQERNKIIAAQDAILRRLQVAVGNPPVANT
ncbi:MAG: hypothetical protein NT069_11540 [Planctomycetota bacterium]|nr:hypothetical protein [Planctomycetota bacterium]